MNHYSFTWPNLLVVALTTGIFVLFTLWMRHLSAGGTAGMARPAIRFAGLYGMLLILASALALSGFFADLSSTPPRPVFIFILIFSLLGIVIASRVKGSLAMLTQTPVHWLVYFQTFRVLVEIALWGLHRESIIPRELTFEGQNFDIAIGALALPAGMLLQRKTGFANTAALIFNVLGLLSLINIARIAALSVPTPIRAYDLNLLPLYFPGLLIPLVFVFCAAAAHVMSLKQTMRFSNPQ